MENGKGKREKGKKEKRRKGNAVLRVTASSQASTAIKKNAGPSFEVRLVAGEHTSAILPRHIECDFAAPYCDELALLGVPLTAMDRR